VWVSKVNELIGSSPESFDEAARQVVRRASRTLSGITGVEVLEKRVKTDGGTILEYRVRLRLVFDMASEAVLHW
jgi:flavin-binding protein dodecin